MDFYEVALAKLLQTLPELGNYIVTFKDVSEELQDSDEIKVGVFILRSGNEIYYIPVVSKADSVYPIDSVFFESRGKFFPLTKKTVDLIMGFSGTEPGKAKEIPKTVPINPDMTSMINPPRTGKFVYASSSRLTEFLASMPEHIKTATFEKFAQEKTLYSKLHSMYGFQSIAESLHNKVASAPAKATPEIFTEKHAGMTDEQLGSLVKKGYAISGRATESTRVAVSSFSADKGRFTQTRSVDGDRDYEIVFRNGSTRDAFIPKLVCPSLVSRSNLDEADRHLAIFTNGDFSVSNGGFITVGEQHSRKEVLSMLFEYNPPILPKDVERGVPFAILNTKAEVIGVFRAERVMQNYMGTEIKASNLLDVTAGSVTIYAYKNFAGSFQYDRTGKELYIPHVSLVLKLNAMILSDDLETNVNSALMKSEISETRLLGSTINLGFDGVEYSMNGMPFGKEANLIKHLVVEEGIDPSKAEVFIKEARENKFTKIYLSKKASTDFRPGEMPQFGNQMPPQPKTTPAGSFIPNVQAASMTEDPQVTEAAIISELLQIPDMFEMIEEYLPDIEEAIDKLGRILFVSRVHIQKLSNNNDMESIFAFLASLKTVYRMLGDNLIKLRELGAAQGPMSEE